MVRRIIGRANVVAADFTTAYNGTVRQVRLETGSGRGVQRPPRRQARSEGARARLAGKPRKSRHTGPRARRHHSPRAGQARYRREKGPTPWLAREAGSRLGRGGSDGKRLRRLGSCPTGLGRQSSQGQGRQQSHRASYGLHFCILQKQAIKVQPARDAGRTNNLTTSLLTHAATRRFWIGSITRGYPGLPQPKRPASFPQRFRGQSFLASLSRTAFPGRPLREQHNAFRPDWLKFEQ